MLDTLIPSKLMRTPRSVATKCLAPSIFNLHLQCSSNIGALSNFSTSISWMCVIMILRLSRPASEQRKSFDVNCSAGLKSTVFFACFFFFFDSLFSFFTFMDFWVFLSVFFALLPSLNARLVFGCHDGCHAWLWVDFSTLWSRPPCQVSLRKLGSKWSGPDPPLSLDKRLRCSDNQSSTKTVSMPNTSTKSIAQIQELMICIYCHIFLPHIDIMCILLASVYDYLCTSSIMNVHPFSFMLLRSIPPRKKAPIPRWWICKNMPTLARSWACKGVFVTLQLSSFRISRLTARKAIQEFSTSWFCITLFFSTNWFWNGFFGPKRGWTITFVEKDIWNRQSLRSTTDHSNPQKVEKFLPNFGSVCRNGVARHVCTTKHPAHPTPGYINPDIIFIIIII